MTTIQDNLTYADGRPVNGQVVVSWLPYQLNGTSIAGGMQIFPIVAGAVTITLYANSTALPSGTYYTAVYELEEGALYNEYWIVPDLPQVSLGQVRVSFPSAPSVLINAQQLTSAGASFGQFLGWNGTHWVPMYVGTINFTPNTIGLVLTANAGPDLAVSGSPAPLGQAVTLNVPNASATARGVVSTGAQTFAGQKTFSGGIVVAGASTIAGYVPSATQVNTGHGLSGGGALISNLNLAVVDDSNVQRVAVLLNTVLEGTRSRLNFVSGTNISLSIADNPGANEVDITITGTISSAVTSVFGRAGIVTAQAGDYTVAQVTGAVASTRLINTGTGLTGGGDLSADRTISGVVMGPSGAGHAMGMVPDPGATAGGTRYLREDGTWAIPSGTGGGMTDPTTTVGDLIVRGLAAPTRLGVGTNGQVLTADSTQTLGVKWATPVGAVSSVFGRTGAIVAQAGDYTAAQVTNAVSAVSTYSDPTWITSLAWSKITGAPAFMADPTTTKGDLIAHGTITTRLAVGTDGQVLTADSTQTLGVKWAAAPAGTGTSFSVYSLSGIQNGINTVFTVAATLTSFQFFRNGMLQASPGDYTFTSAGGVTTLTLGVPPDATDSLGLWAGSAGGGGGGGAVSSVFGRTGAVVAATGDYTAAQVTNAVSTASTYADPAWITSLAWSKIASAPAFLADPTTTKGDLIAHGTSTTRLGVGTDGQVLTADSTQALGVKWAVSAGGAQTPWTSNINGAGFSLTGAASITTASNITSGAAFLAAMSGGYQFTGGGWQLFQSGSDFYVRDTVNAVTSIHSAAGNPGNVRFPGSVNVGADAAPGATLTVTGTTSLGGNVTFSSDNLYNIGAAGANRPLNIYLGQGVLSLNAFCRVSAGSDGVPQLTNNAGTGFQRLILGATASGVAVKLSSGTMAFRNGADTADCPITAAAATFSGNVTAPNIITMQPSGATHAAGFAPDPGATAGATRYLREDATWATVSASQTPWTSNIDAATHTLTNVGNVGIGTASPTAQLQVLGAAQSTAAINTSGALGGTVLLEDSGSASGNGGAVIFAAAQGSFAAIKGLITNGGGNTVGDLAFSTRNAIGDASLTERMRIAASGNVGIGTASPAQLLHVNGNTVIAGNLGIGLTSPTYPFHLSGNANITGNVYIVSGGAIGIGLTSTSFYLQIFADSAGKPGTSTWSVTSDIRVKRNVEDMADDSLAILNALRWIRFEYNGQAQQPEGMPAVGLHAQELQPYLGEAVRSSKRKLLETDQAEADVLAIDYHHILVHAARAIQQLSMRVAELEAKLP